MKINLSSDELDELEAMSDGDLAELVRGSLRKFRGKSKAEAEDDIPGADPSSAGHGGRSESTLETPASQRAGTIRATEDSAQRAARERMLSAARQHEASAGTLAATDSARQAAIERTQAAVRQMHEAGLAQAERNAEAATVVKGYNRL